MRTDQVISNLPRIRDRFPVIGKGTSEFLPSIASIEVIRHRGADILPFAIKDPPVYCESPCHIVEDDYKPPFTYTMAYYDSVTKNNSKYSDKGALISIYA